MDTVRGKIYRLLRASERYIKTDMLYLAKGGFWLALNHGVTLLSGLILSVAFANLLPKEVYGTYQFIMTGAALLSACTLSGMATAITRAVARGHTGTLQVGFRTQFKWSIGIILGGAGLALYYFINGNNTLAISFLIVGALSPFLEGYSLYKGYLMGKKMFRENVTLGFWRKLVPFACVLGALLLTDDPILLVLVYFASNTFSVGLIYRLMIRRYPEPTEPNSEMITYSKHLSVMGVIDIVSSNADRILIFHFLGAVPFAVYNFAILPTLQFQRLFGLAGDLIFPKFAQRDFSTLKNTIFHKFLMALPVAIAIVALYIIAAPYIFSTLFPAYPEAVILSQVAILAMLTKPSMIYGQVFLAHHMERIQYFLKISTAIVRVLLFLVLLPIYGIWGAIGAFLAVHIYWNIAAVVLFYARKS